MDVRDTEAEEMETVIGLDIGKVKSDASAVLSHFYWGIADKQAVHI